MVSRPLYKMNILLDFDDGENEEGYFDYKMNTQFQPCIQYKRTFDVTEDHDSHRIVVDYARATNRSAGKKNIRRVQNLEIEEVLYTYDMFVDACNDLGMPDPVRDGMKP
eukprot:jgi/Psemu1/53963/gm1.53963_g